MTKKEFEKLQIVLENRFSLNEADAISRLITDVSANNEKLQKLLNLIESNNDLDCENYDEIINNY